MRDSRSTVVIWKWSIPPALAILFLSLIPQTHFWFVRGSQWQGGYAILQGDETYYSAYINALIEGRPRRNDPFTGQDDHPNAPMFESLFSIQCVPPYVMVFVAKALGLSASSAFIVLSGVAGVLAGLAIFWLLASVTGDSRFAAVGVIGVLCLGALTAGQGWGGLILKSDAMFAGQLYLRRYLPSAAFWLFFVFCCALYQALTIANKKWASASAALAGLTLAGLIFSYFYLWTAAAAWFVCIICLWMVLRRADNRRTVLMFIIASVPILLALVLYAYLLSRLPPAVEQAQALTFTRYPDLLRIPELIGAIILVRLLLAIRHGRISSTDGMVIFAASFALLPFIVFNQQVITGRSIQPYHYEVFIVNYVVLIALAILIKLLRAQLANRTLIIAACLCFLWGVVEVNQQFKLRSTFDVYSDEMVPVLLRLKDLSISDGTWEALRAHGKTNTVVFSTRYGVSRLLPTWAPQPSLLAPGSAAFQSLSPALRREWLFTHLYYCGRNGDYLIELLNNRTDDLPFSYFAKSTIFGNERTLLFLGWNAQAINQGEIEQVAKSYDLFVNSFSREIALKRPLRYVITFAEEKSDLSRIDLWYERDSGQRIGAYILYSLKPRDETK